MDDLTALKQVRGSNGGRLHMNDQASESKFDNLVSAETIEFDNLLLMRVPSVKNMASLMSLWLAGDQITTISPMDFAGAVRLVVLSLGGNRITSVAPEAFANLVAFRVLPTRRI